MTRQKRLFDVLFAMAGLLSTAPLLALVAAGVKLSDGGPVFFRQERVGYRGITFRIWKFRTMATGAEMRGGQLTVGDDPRITPLGRWLRKLKLDELPQLLNVLSGEMTLVGPRPEVPRYVARYTDEQRRVLELVPGITDPASIKYYDESERLALSDDPERCYLDVVMPEKVAMNLDYAHRATLATDADIIIQTLRRILS